VKFIVGDGRMFLISLLSQNKVGKDERRGKDQAATSE
jgi:hypothetical protein